MQSIPIFYSSDKLGLGFDHYGDHLSAVNAGVLAGAASAGAEVEAVAGVENIILAVVQRNGHLALLYVVDHLEVSGSHVCAAAGEEVGKAHNDGAVVNVSGVVQTGGLALVMAGSLVLDGLVLHSDFVAHRNQFLSYILFRG